MHLAPLFDGRTFDAVLFDLDGTLIDSTASVERAWTRWAAEEGVARERLRGSHGMPAAEIVARLLPPERAAAAFQRILDYEVTDVAGIVPRPGTAAALASLPAGRAAIVTSCTRALAAARGGAAGLVAPAAVVTIDDVERGKPDPAPFLAGARILGVAPERCLAVEDAPAGLASARAAGCTTLAVDGTHALDALDADAAVPDLSHVRFVTGPDGVAVLSAAPSGR
ncbi:HAD-IA family hydrolase [Conexibacter woesei]|uniref:HAD-superfamily hydrolase, subfamily IA, variant 3 n=1 Tax=Conexibacter woesei (strain DSM 14684 / CCUG 47730 / CIP 108061 / JCM 11494 / NBRC 100937 / ID131577) TaxID=469383 RepID=D3FF20_CONWI|nr:HAD-superfamily hydrolase, subfamily IA, variant 3 [Conexibacter woesei DSM 14684]